MFSQNRKNHFIKGFCSLIVATAFLFSTILSPHIAQAQTLLNLPIPGTLLSASAGFVPTMIQGLTIHADNPLRFNFIVDTGNEQLEGEEFRSEAKKLINYFLASLTVPEDELWVNLSPYEKDRIIPESLGVTEMGRDLLAQDYLLKQLTASMLYPEDELGSSFWQRVYQRAQNEYGTTDIPINTFNKVWIVPDKAAVYEYQGSVFVVERHLKVMLEADYLALQKNEPHDNGITSPSNQGESKIDSGLMAEVVREILIPELEREINEGKNFANLRQVYNSMILATWYKKNLKESLLGQVYMDQNKVKGVDIVDKQIKFKIYNQYLKAFKQGVYDYIREEFDPNNQEVVLRKYFSGGMVGLAEGKLVEYAGSPLQLPKKILAAASSTVGKSRSFLVDFLPSANENLTMLSLLAFLTVGAMTFPGGNLRAQDNTPLISVPTEEVANIGFFLERVESFLADVDIAQNEQKELNTGNDLDSVTIFGLSSGFLNLIDQSHFVTDPLSQKNLCYGSCELMTQTLLSIQQGTSTLDNGPLINDIIIGVSKILGSKENNLIFEGEDFKNLQDLSTGLVAAGDFLNSILRVDSPDSDVFFKNLNDELNRRLARKQEEEETPNQEVLLVPENIVNSEIANSKNPFQTEEDVPSDISDISDTEMVDVTDRDVNEKDPNEEDSVWFKSPIVLHSFLFFLGGTSVFLFLKQVIVWRRESRLKENELLKPPEKSTKGSKSNNAGSSSIQAASTNIRNSASTDTLGGINFNPGLLDLQIKRDGKGIPLPLNEQPLQDMNIEGFLPVIINVTPISVPSLLGLVEQEDLFNSAQGRSAENEKWDVVLATAELKKRYDIDPFVLVN